MKMPIDMRWPIGLWGVALIAIALGGRAGAVVHRRDLHPAKMEGGFMFPLERVENTTRGLLRYSSLPLHGSVRENGYYYTNLQLGSPPKNFAVIMDTGSTITYVPCKECGHSCGSNHVGEAFDKAASTTFEDVMCSTPNCLTNECHTISGNRYCYYSRYYAEDSSSAGLIISDHMAFNDGQDGVQVIFGCELQESGEIYNQEADGIMGLGSASVSIIDQLADAGVIDDAFSLCYGAIEGGGVLILGDPPLPEWIGEIQWTPMKTSSAHPTYYIATLESWKVGTRTLQVAKSVWAMGHGVVFDSGTTFTYIPTAAFNAFASAVDQQVQGLTKVDGPDPQYEDICYSGAPTDTTRLAEVFPTMAVTFLDNMVLDLDPVQYLFAHTRIAGAYCLGVFDYGYGGTLLGGVTTRNTLIKYDRKNRRIGVVKADCHRLKGTALPAYASPPPCPPPPAPPAGSPPSPASSDPPPPPPGSPDPTPSPTPAGSPESPAAPGSPGAPRPPSASPSPSPSPPPSGDAHGNASAPPCPPPPAHAAAKSDPQIEPTSFAMGAVVGVLFAGAAVGVSVGIFKWGRCPEVLMRSRKYTMMDNPSAMGVEVELPSGGGGGAGFGGVGGGGGGGATPPDGEGLMDSDDEGGGEDLSKV